MNNKTVDQINHKIVGINRAITGLLVTVVFGITGFIAIDYFRFKDARHERDLEITGILASLNSTTAALSQGVSDRYTATQADGDFAQVNAELSKIRERLRKLEIGARYVD